MSDIIISKKSSNSTSLDEDTERFNTLLERSNTSDQSPMTVKQWTRVMVLSILTGGILPIIWAGSKNVSTEKKNWSIATLIVTSVVLAIYLFFMIVITFVALGLMENWTNTLSY